MKKFILIISFISMIFALSSTKDYYIDYDKINFYEVNKIKDATVSQEDESAFFIEVEYKIIQVINSHTIDLLADKPDGDITCQEVEIYKANRRKRANDYYEVENQALADLIDLKGYSTIYISKYSPLIEYTFTSDAYEDLKYTILSNLSIDEVETINVCDSAYYKYEDQMSFSFSEMQVSDMVRNGPYSGAGIKVGILESGVVDTDHINVRGKGIVKKSYIFNNETDHATKMASIIGGNTGIAKNAKIYSAQVVGSISDELDWFMDKGVDVINMSFGDHNNFGHYNITSSIVDYYVYFYEITVVAAAGNNDDGSYNVDNPGLGYNVITVGAANGTCVRKMDFSCYKEYSDSPYKPTIIAPGADVIIPGYSTLCAGTSYSTAFTTGVIALLFEEFGMLRIDPAYTIAAVTTGTREFGGDNYPPNQDNGFNDFVGAGFLDYQLIRQTMIRDLSFVNETGQPDEVIFSYYTNVSAGECIKAAVCALAYSSNRTINTTYTNYTIELLTEDGEIVEHGSSCRSIVDLITYCSPVTRRYQIRVIQETVLDHSLDYVSVVYRKY